MQMTAAPYEPIPSLAHGRAVVDAPWSRPCAPRELADLLMLEALGRGAATIWLQPASATATNDRHRVTLERRDRIVGEATLRDGLGDAVIARFALMTGIDLLSPRVQTGRSSVRLGARSFELISTVRATAHGLAAELRVIDDRPAPAGEEISGSCLPADLPAGFAVGPYRITDVVGRGGMGVVYSAEHALLQRRVAIKVLRPAHEVNDTTVEEFVREARTTARIRHPGIVDVLDVSRLADGRPYIVMELVAGHSLGHLLNEYCSLPALRAVRIARNIALALGAAHDAGVIHRDLSINNVFVLGDHVIKLVDFGTARRLEDATPPCPNGIVFGTPRYIAPEQARGWECTERTDLYSLGVLLFEMLQGQAPFSGESGVELARHHVVTPAPPVSSPRETLPAALEATVARLLSKNPDNRHQTAAELAEDLRGLERSLARAGWRRWLPA